MGGGSPTTSQQAAAHDIARVWKVNDFLRTRGGPRRRAGADVAEVRSRPETVVAALPIELSTCARTQYVAAGNDP
jgi:hypothetical protein